MRSLRVKILAVAATLVLLSQAGTVTGVLVAANRSVGDRARHQLEVGGRIFEQTMQARASQLGNTVSILAADYAFKQAVASRDTETISSALANHARRAGAPVAFFLDDQGLVVAATGDLPASAAPEPATVEAAAEHGVGRTVATYSGRSFEMITVPVRAPLPIGWVSMGFPLDDAHMRRFENLTGLQSSLVTSVGGPTLIASSLAGDTRSELSLAVNHIPSRGSSTFDLGGTEYLVLTMPYFQDSTAVTVVLTQSLAEAMAPFRLLSAAAFFLAAAPLLLALAGAVLLSRTLTRPVQQLAEAARRMKVGDYSHPVPVSTGDELAELAITFNAMQGDIARREERITHQARHDSLTGLSNRDFALEQLEAAITDAGASAEPVSIMVLSLNGARDIAESLGHDIADEYICQAAEQLRLQMDTRFALARLEADSFLILMPGENAAGAAEVAERLLPRLEAGISLPNLTVHVRPVMGISSFPEHGESADHLLLRATVALPTVGTGQPIGQYHGGDENGRVRRLTILGDVRRAVRREELYLVYQPKVALADGSVCGAEALVRWDHPVLGNLSPAEFIPIAEQSGNIAHITRWALQTAIRECRFWQEEGLEIPVSVNLAASDLLDRDLPWFIAELLRNHDLAPRYLVAEITEEGLVRDLAHARLVLERLREMGIRISIDDFGAGYSSLGQIRNLPVDELKIDKSFVQKLPDERADAAIVRTAIALAHDLGMEFVAEGVETDASLHWLREQGCDRIQGYLVSRPLPANEFVGWVRAWRAPAHQDLTALYRARNPKTVGNPPVWTTSAKPAS